MKLCSTKVVLGNTLGRYFVVQEGLCASLVVHRMIFVRKV